MEPITSLSLSQAVRKAHDLDNNNISGHCHFMAIDLMFRRIINCTCYANTLQLCNYNNKNLLNGNNTGKEVIES